MCWSDPLRQETSSKLCFRLVDVQYVLWTFGKVENDSNELCALVGDLFQKATCSKHLESALQYLIGLDILSAALSGPCVQSCRPHRQQQSHSFSLIVT